MKRYGDLQLIENGKDYLVIACDSAGSIGDKEMDVVQLDPELVGYSVVFVPIVEIMAIRGSIISLVDTLCVEMEPTGRKIIKGIQKALEEIGLDKNLVTGSTEENMPSVSTGIGVTVIGSVPMETIESTCVEKGMKLCLAGVPKMGQTYLEEEVFGKYGEVLSLSHMGEFSKNNKIADMIPVGSKGIAYEAGVLAKRHKLELELFDTYHKEMLLDYQASAGPATCLLIAVKEDYLADILRTNKVLPIYCIGEFK